MSVYQKVLKVLEDHITCTMVQLDKSSCLSASPKVVNLKAGDFIQIGLKAQPRFSMGSCASYALENGGCPIESIKHAKEMSHEIHWISSQGSILTSHQQEKVQIIVLEDGELIRFEGHYFTVHPDHNCNMKLKPYDEKAVKYPYIEAWGKMLGSFSSYIDLQITLARKYKAPENAIYQETDGTWSTVDDIQAGITRKTVEKICKEILEGTES